MIVGDNILNALYKEYTDASDTTPMSADQTSLYVHCLSSN